MGDLVLPRQKLLGEGALEATSSNAGCFSLGCLSSTRGNPHRPLYGDATVTCLEGIEASYFKVLAAPARLELEDE